MGLDDLVAKDVITCAPVEEGAMNLLKAISPAADGELQGALRFLEQRLGQVRGTAFGDVIQAGLDTGNRDAALSLNEFLHSPYEARTVLSGDAPRLAELFRTNTPDSIARANGELKAAVDLGKQLPPDATAQEIISRALQSGTIQGFNPWVGRVPRLPGS